MADRVIVVTKHVERESQPKKPRNETCGIIAGWIVLVVLTVIGFGLGIPILMWITGIWWLCGLVVLLTSPFEEGR